MTAKRIVFRAKSTQNPAFCSPGSAFCTIFDVIFQSRRVRNRVLGRFSCSFGGSPCGTAESFALLRPGRGWYENTGRRPRCPVWAGPRRVRRRTAAAVRGLRGLLGGRFPVDLYPGLLAPAERERHGRVTGEPVGQRVGGGRGQNRTPRGMEPVMSDLLGLAGLVGSFYRDGLDGVTGACLPSGLAVRRKPGVFRHCRNP